jgi:hypothetical protein
MQLSWSSVPETEANGRPDGREKAVMQDLAHRIRATRYELSAPMMYRCLGEDAWRRGRTENISRSGVLFAADQSVLPARTRIEFILKLPDGGPPGGSWVKCEGQVVRHGSGASEGVCVMAATIDAYDFLGSRWTGAEL